MIDKSTNTAIYEPGTYNARGHMMHFAMNNKSLYTTFGYDDFGLPTYRMTGNYYPTSSNIQNLETNFDAQTGNLNWRKDHKRNLTENFTYDAVHKNRLATWQVQGQQQYSTTYNNANGNILTKTDFTSPGNPYTYGLGAGPHAVTGVVSPLIVPAEAEQEIRYNGINKASRIIHHSQDLELVLHYGPDEQRIKTEYKINGQPTLTRYFPGGGLEVEVDANGRERWLHYLPGGGLYVCDENFDKIGMYYVLTDYLGSWDKVISETGAPIEEYSFDPWGRRRNPTNWTYTGVPSSFTFNRGYTGHEMLDAFGLVNMNGRMYDPVLGRMLSPDNYVSSASSTQAFNRYSYALNNPLIITDPSGDHPALIAMIAYSAIVGGLSSAKNGDGFLQGFGTGVATGALSYGVGAAIGPVVSGSGVWANMANAGIHTAIAGGMTYGVDALVNNTAFNWKAYGLNIATSMAMAGLSYQKPASPVQSNMLDDLRAAGIESDMGSGFGMRFGGNPPYKKIYEKEGFVIYDIAPTEIIDTPIKKQSWLSQYWNSEYMRMKFPDHIALSIGANSTLVRGQSMVLSFNLLTRGQEPGFSITVTDQERIVGEVDWGFNLTMSRYEGNPMDINKASLEGKVKSISAAWGFGGEVYKGYNPSGKVIWKGASAGVGLSYGASYGSGTTRQIWP